jgi:hypothetical protein
MTEAGIQIMIVDDNEELCGMPSHLLTEVMPCSFVKNVRGQFI